MRNLTTTLLTAQKQGTSTPFVKVEASNRMAGVVKLKWDRLYAGTEDDYLHAVTMPGDGSLIRARITLPDDSRKLYRQRVADPGPESDFSQWAYTGEYDVLAVACCSLGAEVSVFWIKSNRSIYQQKSANNGASWDSPQLLGYASTNAVGGIAAAYRQDGDIALFYADQATLYVMKRISGNWQSAVAWDKTTGDLSGVAAVYDNDWNLLVTGRDSSGNYKLWSLIYGDGGEVNAGVWSDLKAIASAPSDGDYEYKGIFIDKPDVHRCFFVENFSGTEPYSRPFWSYSLPDAGFLENSWREPVPFNLSSEYGLAIAHHGDYCWLSSPCGVWRAKLVVETLDLSDDVLAVRQESERDDGKLVVELRNDDGRYGSPGQGDLAVLDTGCQVDSSPGYVTTKVSEILRPNGAGDEENIHHATSGAGNHWQDVDDIVPDGDASVVWESTLDDNYYRDLYAVSSPALSGAVRSVTVFARCRSYLVPGTRPGLKLAVKTHGAVYEGPEETLVTSYADYSCKWDTNPHTGQPWTGDEIDDLQFGLALRDGRTPPMQATSICTQIYAVVEYGGLGEGSAGQTFILDAYEHTSAGGQASLILHARDGWSLVKGWVARHQFRWNADTDEACVKDILAFGLARAGLKLEVKSQSSVITGFFPDFTIHPGNRGESVIARLLSFVPDVLFVEGNKAYLVNPQISDSSIYSYGVQHQIYEGRYLIGAWDLNRVLVEGCDPESGEAVVVDSFAWGEIERLYDRFIQIEDRNVGTVADAQERGEAHLRKAEVESDRGFIRLPVNCGQQLYDVVDITDERAGLEAVEKRVLGLSLYYKPESGLYEQRLLLGTV